MGGVPSVRTLGRLAAERAGTWFPELAGAPVDVGVTVLSARPRCSLFRVRLSDARQARQVVVKVRSDGPFAAGRPAGERSGLVPDALPAAAQAAVEYAGLCAFATRFGDDPRFGVVRPRDHIAELDAVVMDHIDQPTLRRVLLAGSRFSGLPRDARLRRTSDRAWGNAGAWLRAFHASTGEFDTQPRNAVRDDVVRAFDDYVGFLDARVGRGLPVDLHRRARAVLEQALPERLPTAVGHGDFAARNMFVDGAGRISVFDPLPRWRVPVYEDLSRFLVGVRLLGLQVHSHGIAYPEVTLARREGAFLDGYFGTDPPDRAAALAYQLLILLDKWSALVSRPRPRRAPQKSVDRARRGWVDGYVRCEAQRLLAEAERA